jgi:hypothetical protein
MWPPSGFACLFSVLDRDVATFRFCLRVFSIGQRCGHLQVLLTCFQYWTEMRPPSGFACVFSVLDRDATTFRFCLLVFSIGQRCGHLQVLLACFQYWTEMWPPSGFACLVYWKRPTGFCWIGCWVTPRFSCVLYHCWSTGSAHTATVNWVDPCKTAVSKMWPFYLCNAAHDQISEPLKKRY